MFDREYVSGFGDRLEAPENLEHYRMLVEFMVDAGKNQRILDVGCGEGLLLDCLEGCGYQKYVGIDFSEVALRNASKRANAKTSFVNGPAESFSPDDLFESIVFNELLYCLTDPLRVIRRYERFLAPGGVMLVSLFTKTERIQLLAAEVSRKFTVTRHAAVANAGGTWDCSMLIPALGGGRR